MPIQVRTPARLHLGLLDLSGSLGRKFGGLGVAIQKPNVKLAIYPEKGLVLEGAGVKQLQELIERFHRHFQLEPGVRVRVTDTIPAHIGLGSGTQLRLALADGLARFYGLKVPLTELARIMSRGESRSAIGSTAYASGGFIVDGGLKVESLSSLQRGVAPPPVLFRYDFPEDWFAVITIPAKQCGLDEKTETRAFKKLSPMSDEDSGRICRLLLMKLLPSLLEHEAQAFGEALSEIQEIIGRYFAPVQGGYFSSPVSYRLVEFCLKEGVLAASQSSWGPSIYAFVEGKAAAKKLKDKMESALEDLGGGSVLIAAADNKGAVVTGSV
ncbi:MAG: GHMP kinase [Firmicutes bacterium]|nr:GHMP kinase [Bacillota bacterium]